MTDACSTPLAALDPSDGFVPRHIGPDEAEIESMLDALGHASLDALASAVVPDAIRMEGPLALAGPQTEQVALQRLRAMAEQNTIARSMIGMGYHDTITPPVILRNVLENPGWYTQYTPYQAEIAQGRLEALLAFQTMISDLTGLPIAGASLLDEATAAAEAMAMCDAHAQRKRRRFFVSEDCHPQTIAVMQSRADSLGIELVVGAAADCSVEDKSLCGLLVQYPDTCGPRRRLPRACRTRDRGGHARRRRR